jgi:phospholipase/carboxylesterase
MTLEAGFRYGHRFAALVGISGYASEPKTMLKEMSPVAKEQRFLVTHGTYDPLIPIEQVRPQIQFFRAHGLNITWHEFPKEHTIAGQSELAVIRDFVRASYPA